MEIIVDSPNSSLTTKGKLLQFSTEAKSYTINPKNITSIVIKEKKVNISAAFLLLVTKHKIDVMLATKAEMPIGRFWHSHMATNGRIRKNQVFFAASEKAKIEFATLVFNKILNQFALLKHWQTKLKNKVLIKTIMPKIELEVKKILADQQEDSKKADTIILREAIIAKYYYKGINTILPENAKFKKRTRRPAKDEFNALLNYAYGMLYRKVEKYVLLQGLEPFIGFYHMDDYNAKSLVYDLIEPYRPWADNIVIEFLRSNREEFKSFFYKSSEGISLNKLGKKQFIPMYNQYFEEKCIYNNKKRKRKNHIKNDIAALSTRILNFK